MLIGRLYKIPRITKIGVLENGNANFIGADFSWIPSFQVLQARRGPTLAWQSVSPELEDRLNQFLSKKK